MPWYQRFWSSIEFHFHSVWVQAVPKCITLHFLRLIQPYLNKKFASIMPMTPPLSPPMPVYLKFLAETHVGLGGWVFYICIYVYTYVYWWRQQDKHQQINRLSSPDGSEKVSGASLWIREVASPASFFLPVKGWKQVSRCKVARHQCVSHFRSSIFKQP